MTFANHVGDFLTAKETLQICNKKLASLELGQQNRRPTQKQFLNPVERKRNLL